jgi:signal transduction histidine kinase
MSDLFERRRAEARRNLLRANTAVAFVLLAVIVLALLAVSFSLRSRAHQRRAEIAQAEARTELWHAYIADVRALRRDTTLGRRPAAIETIRRAAAIATSTELRNEAVLALALPDFKLEASVPFDPAVSAFQTDKDMRLFAFGLTNGDVVIRGLAEARELARLRRVDGGIPESQSRVANMEFSADARRLSVRYFGGAFAVWDVPGRRVLFQHDADKYRRPAATARFSSDGAFVVAPVFKPNDGMAVFAVESGEQVALFPEISSFRHCAIRPDTTMFAANDGTNVVVVDWTTRRHVASFDHAAGVRTLAWSADGRLLAIGGNLAETHVWDFEKRERRVLAGQNGDIWALAFEPDGTRLAASSFDGSTRIWDARDGRPDGVTMDGYVTRWAPGGRVILDRPRVALEIRRLTDSPVFQPIAGPAHQSNGRNMDITPDGAWAVSVAGTNGFFVWNLREPAAPELVPMPRVRSVCFHPSEPRLFITRSPGPVSLPFVALTNNGRATLRFGEPEPAGGVPGYRVDQLTTSSNAETLALVERSGGHIWTAKAGRGGSPRWLSSVALNSLADLSGSPRGSGSVALSPDGRWLAVGAGGGKGAVVCDVDRGDIVQQLAPHEGPVHFSRDGRWIVLAGKLNTRLFRADNWSPVWQYDLPRHEETANATLSPDGSMVATVKSPRALALLDTVTGRELCQLEAPDAAPVVSLRWSDDGERLVCATRNNHLQIWRTGSLRRELAALGLDWNLPAPGLAVVSAIDRSGPWIATAVFATAGLVTLVALLSLRRHRRLVEGFAETEALAAQRGRELEIERELGRLKSNFVSLVSHEFRTPLGVIQSSAQILDRYLDRLPPEQRREQLVSITNNVRRMAGMIDDILLLGKVEAGQLPFTPAPLDLAGFCRRLTDEMLSATRQRCPIRLELGNGELAPARGDENLLRHILGNLLSNAAKYSPADAEVAFTVTRRDGDAVFTIRDRGIGIPAADQDKLFVAFHRGANAGEFQGTGLGLTIVKRCLDLHGGEVSFTSAEGRGTTVTVRVPVFGPANQSCS